MSEMLSYGLLALVIGLAILLIYALSLLKSIQQESNFIREQATIIHTQGEVQKEAIGNLDFSVKPEVITAGIAASGGALKGAVAGTMKDLRISEDIGKIRSSADSVASEVAEIQKIFLDKQAAAGWAEIELERILKDSFAKVSIRKRVPKLDSIPDANLKLSDGRILCIDSKFPIKAFKDTLAASEGGEGEEDGRSRKGSRKAFIDAVKGHIEKVESSYIRPELGTTEVAYLYIASQRIYDYLIDPDNQDESSLIRDAASRGVVVCSPNTLIANMHLLHIAERAMGIAEKSDEIFKGHTRLRGDLNELHSVWGTLSTQISNSYSNRTKLQESMESLERALNSLESLDLGEDED
tara:strand:- start:276 stop:1334 length:1059 start_codon:yes stop_codon:yes gene_type:complete